MSGLNVRVAGRVAFVHKRARLVDTLTRKSSLENYTSCQASAATYRMLGRVDEEPAEFERGQRSRRNARERTCLLAGPQVDPPDTQRCSSCP